MDEFLVKTKGIVKNYPGVKALKGIDCNIPGGRVVCIVGENGAGKSTFIKILTGAEHPDEGTMEFAGKSYAPRSIREAQHAGISVLYQELNIVDQLTVRENLSLGKEKSRLGILDKKDIVADRALEILAQIAPQIVPEQRTETLSVAEKQIVQIAKAVAEEARMIIMDEPTAAISSDEVSHLFRIIKELKNRKVTVIYITHRLDEIFEIGDDLIVFRDGQLVGSSLVAELESKQDIIRLMLGKVIFETYQPVPCDHRNVVLSVKNLNNRVLRNVSFDLYKGEILGFYGLVGAGKTEIARALYGADAATGSITVNGRELVKKNPRSAIAHGMALIPEERRTQGIFGIMSILDNINIMNLKQVVRIRGIVSRQKAAQVADEYIQRMRIATSSADKPVMQLSGGNQQKVVLSKCINSQSGIILLDEPTRGVDVGAKQEIYNVIRELSAGGISIVVFSSEMDEIFNLCGRVNLLSDGEIVSTLENDGAITQEHVMAEILGGRI